MYMTKNVFNLTEQTNSNYICACVCVILNRHVTLTHSLLCTSVHIQYIHTHSCICMHVVGLSILFFKCLHFVWLVQLCCICFVLVFSSVIPLCLHFFSPCKVHCFDSMDLFEFFWANNSLCRTFSQYTKAYYVIRVTSILDMRHLLGCSMYSVLNNTNYFSHIER